MIPYFDPLLGTFRDKDITQAEKDAKLDVAGGDMTGTLGLLDAKLSPTTEPAGNPPAGQQYQWLENGLLWRKDESGRYACDELGYREYATHTVCARPLNASAYLLAQPSTDAIKITLPQGFTGVIHRFSLLIGDYNDASETAEIIISGQSSTASGGSWYAEKAVVSAGSRDFRVRFGHDGTNCCIILGTEGSEDWDAVNIQIVNWQGSSTGHGSRNWATGWSISQISSTAGITFTGDVTAEHPRKGSWEEIAEITFDATGLAQQDVPITAGKYSEIAVEYYGEAGNYVLIQVKTGGVLRTSGYETSVETWNEDATVGSYTGPAGYLCRLTALQDATASYVTTKFGNCLITGLAAGEYCRAKGDGSDLDADEAAGGVISTTYTRGHYLTDTSVVDGIRALVNTGVMKNAKLKVKGLLL